MTKTRHTGNLVFCLFKCCFILTALCVNVAANATVIVAENGDHGGWNIIPFGTLSGDSRYQQIYSSDLFSSAISLSSIGFSADKGSSYSANIDIRFTTTTMAVGKLSANLDKNYNSSLTSVYSDASFSTTIEGGSEAFGLTFDFSPNPFIYDPSDGNLLMDILVSDQNLVPLGFPVSTGFSQARGGVSGNSYSRAWNISNPNYPVGSDTGGLRTQFDFQSVPEPTSYMLLLSGLIGLGFARRFAWKY